MCIVSPYFSVFPIHITFRSDFDLGSFLNAQYFCRGKTPSFPSCHLQIQENCLLLINLLLTTDLSSWAAVLAKIFRCGVDLKHLKFSDKKECKYFARQSQLRYRQNFSQDWGDYTHCCTKNRNASPSKLYLVLLVQKWSREGAVLSISPGALTPLEQDMLCTIYLYLPISKGCRFIFFFLPDMRNVGGSTGGLESCL